MCDIGPLTDRPEWESWGTGAFSQPIGYQGKTGEEHQNETLEMWIIWVVAVSRSSGSTKFSVLKGCIQKLQTCQL